MDSSGLADLCAGSYIARRVAGHIVLFALGVHHAAGFNVFFRREPGDAFPPCFSLWHVRSTDPELHVLTPFAATALFQTTHHVECVEVVDANGRRKVVVDQPDQTPAD